MRLEPLYRLRFDYPEGWGADLKGDEGTETQLLLFANGTVDGNVRGRFRGSNYARRRTDRTYVTDFRGVIVTDDGAEILLECRGFGRRKSPEYDRLSPGRRQWVATVVHLSEAESYTRLNDVVCVGVGEVRPKSVENPTNPSDLVLDVSELVWEPIPD